MKMIIFLLYLLAPLSIWANVDAPLLVAIGEAEREKELITVINSDPSQRDSITRRMSNEISTIFKNDFSFYKNQFQIVEKSASNLSTSFLQRNKLSHGIDFSLTKSGDLYFVKIKLVSLQEGKSERFSSDTFKSANLRSITHSLANRVYEKLTGKKSIFNSRIIFVSDKKTRGSKRVKELYSMDFDGKNIKQVTFFGGTVISPAFSYDGKKVLFSLIKNSRSKKRNINLYILDLESGKSRLLSSKKGINSGAVFMPDDKNIALTMSHQGNAELYAINIETKKVRRITKHYGPDVDPSINAKGDLMAFLSGRSGAGKPMIYISDPRGMEKSVRRISFVGKFNATPRFSPDGSEIAFSSWLDNKFDIFRIGATGEGLYRLTKDFGSNEDPTYSNDGQFIAFSSQRVISTRKAVQNIYIMDRDGEVIGQITSNFGNCSSPRWSKY